MNAPLGLSFTFTSIILIALSDSFTTWSNNSPFGAFSIKTDLKKVTLFFNVCSSDSLTTWSNISNSEVYFYQKSESFSLKLPMQSRNQEPRCSIIPIIVWDHKLYMVWITIMQNFSLLNAPK